MLPELSQVTRDGVKEGRMDVLVTRPGGVSRSLVDVVICDARAARSGTCAVAFADAERRKHARYGGAAWALAVELRGRLGDQAVSLLDLLAGEASLVTGARPSTLTRQWRRLQLIAQVYRQCLMQ